MTAVGWCDSRTHIQCDIFSIEAVWYIRHNKKNDCLWMFNCDAQCRSGYTIYFMHNHYWRSRRISSSPGRSWRRSLALIFCLFSCRIWTGISSQPALDVDPRFSMSGWHNDDDNDAFNCGNVARCNQKWAQSKYDGDIGLKLYPHFTLLEEQGQFQTAECPKIGHFSVRVESHNVTILKLRIAVLHMYCIAHNFHFLTYLKS